MISIIVPIYKVEKELRECIDSILTQTYSDFELLLIDDGSPDRCGEICDEYAKRDDRVCVFHIENVELSAARNYGIRRAKGKYIGFVDSDDWIEPNMYEVLYESIEKTNADIAVCGCGENQLDSQRSTNYSERVYQREEALTALLEESISSYAWNKLYRAYLFSDVSFPEGRNYEDLAIMHKLFDKTEKIVAVSIPLYHYRKRSGSITKSYSASNLIDYADAYLSRYEFYRNDLRISNKVMLEKAAKGIAKVWRWWNGCSHAEKKEYNERIKELHHFTKVNLPLFGEKTWPKHLRLSCFFMHSRSKLSFFVLYEFNHIYRRMQRRRSSAEMERLV